MIFYQMRFQYLQAGKVKRYPALLHSGVYDFFCNVDVVAFYVALLFCLWNNN